ncbi:MAG: cytochrome c [Anaerolineales bacterium]|nr:cytochrome c [Anaerolineales bacterium]
MKFRHTLLFIFAGILLAACNQTLAADVTPPPGYVPPTPVPTLGPLYPDQAPDIENGKVIYAEKCAACHGDEGLGNGSQSADLPVAVIPIGLPEFSNDATPSAWYTVVTQGRLDRFMPPFASLTDQERWDVISYALMLQTTPEQIELGKSIFEEKCADCGDAFTNLEMMSALSKANIIEMIRTGSGGFPAFGSDLSEEEAFAVAAYIRTLSFAAPAAPVAVEATEAPATAEAVSTPGEGTAVEGTPQAEVTPEATEAPADNTITGVIDNQTGKDLPADLTITLRGFDHGSDPAAGPTEILNIQGDVNPDGTFAFEAELVENQIYLAEITVEGMKYKTEFAVVPAGATEIVLSPIVVYPTTEDTSVLQVEELQIFFDMAGEETQVFAVFFIMNTSDATVLVPMADGKTIPFISFPEGATGLGYETTDTSAAFVATDNGFAIPPSQDAYGLIAFSTLPTGDTDVIQKTTLPVNSITLFLPEGVDADGATLTDTGVQDLQGTKFHIYNAAPLAQDDALEFTITGKPVTVAESPDVTQNQTVLIGIGAFGVTLILAGIFLYWRDRNKEEDEDDEDDDEDDDMYEDSESIMDAVIALDDLHRSGKIKDEAYNKRRAELMDALKRKG